MPVSYKLLRAGVEVAGALMSEKDDRQGEEEHHVPGKYGEDAETEAAQEFARSAAAQAFPFVVVAVAAATGGAPVYWRFSADAWIFPLGFNGKSRKSAWHGRVPQ
jgi:hypothetical protein